MSAGGAAHRWSHEHQIRWWSACRPDLSVGVIRVAACDVKSWPIDSWPMIPPYLEIQTDSRDEVVEVAPKLGYDASQLTGES